MDALWDRLTALCQAEGVADVGFSAPDDAPPGLPFAVTIVCALSHAVVDEIDGAPTFSYYHHYRTVNTLIDHILYKAGTLLQGAGFRYIPIPASQSIPRDGERVHFGRYSHKKAAVLAGLGHIGRSALFLHRTLGPRVRLGTLFTDCLLSEPGTAVSPGCGACRACAEACPAGALTGEDWRPGQPREALVDAAGCADYMRKNFMGIGRGAVCGVCMRVCPAYQSEVRK